MYIDTYSDQLQLKSISSLIFKLLFLNNYCTVLLLMQVSIIVIQLNSWAWSSFRGSRKKVTWNYHTIYSRAHDYFLLKNISSYSLVESTNKRTLPHNIQLSSLSCCFRPIIFKFSPFRLIHMITDFAAFFLFVPGG